MVPSPKLLTLVRELQQAESPLDRLRHLALAWRTIRDLDADERADLAIALGVDEAHDLVEGLARRRGGLAPTTLLEAVESARQAEPGKLRGLLSDIRQPEKRAGLLERGLAAAQAALIPPEPSSAGLIDDATADADDAPDDTPLDGELYQTETGQKSEEELSPPPPPGSEPDPTPTDLEPDDARVPPPRPHPAPIRPRTQAPTAIQTDRCPPARRAGPAAGRPKPRRERKPVSRLPTLTAAVEEILAAGRPDQQLRRIDRMKSRLVAAPFAALEELVEAMSDGWVRRRVLNRLIEAGLDVESALRLVAIMANPSDRRWCLASLIRNSRLTPAELEQALDLVDSDAHRRQLSRLAARLAS